MNNIDQAFDAFKADPTPENAWELQKQMIAYASAGPSKAEPRKPVKLKTRKGGRWDTLLEEILDLFAAFDWEVVPYKANKYVESWKVTDANLDQAILYLNSNGFSMGGKKPGDALKGAFEGYDEQETFDDFLVSNDIEIE